MLYLFDLDGTLISGYMDNPDRNYHAWEVLPGRRERLDDLRAGGHDVAVVTNQGGVGLGHITEGDARMKFHQVAQALGFRGVAIRDGDVPHYTAFESPLLAVFVAYGHAKSHVKGYQLAAHARKPGPAMLHMAMQWAGVGPDEVLYVGDRDEDEQAAQAAGVRFQWAHLFFKDGQP